MTFVSCRYPITVVESHGRSIRIHDTRLAAPNRFGLICNNADSMILSGMISGIINLLVMKHYLKNLLVNVSASNVHETEEKKNSHFAEIENLTPIGTPCVSLQTFQTKPTTVERENGATDFTAMALQDTLARHTYILQYNNRRYDIMALGCMPHFCSSYLTYCSNL